MLHVTNTIFALNLATARFKKRNTPASADLYNTNQINISTQTPHILSISPSSLTIMQCRITTRFHAQITMFAFKFPNKKLNKQTRPHLPVRIVLVKQILAAQHDRSTLKPLKRSQYTNCRTTILPPKWPYPSLKTWKRQKNFLGSFKNNPRGAGV